MTGLPRMRPLEFIGQGAQPDFDRPQVRQPLRKHVALNVEMSFAAERHAQRGSSRSTKT